MTASQDGRPSAALTSKNLIRERCSLVREGENPDVFYELHSQPFRRVHCTLQAQDDFLCQDKIDVAKVHLESWEEK